MELSEIAFLACGDFTKHPSVQDVFHTLAARMTALEKDILNLPHSNDDLLSKVGPFYGRSLLENTYTAILGRVDPFRIIFLRNVQMHRDFDITKKAKGAISWADDILTNSKNDTREKLWSPEVDFKTVDRGLFCYRYGDCYWKDAYQKLLDVTVDLSDDILDDFRSVTEPDAFIQRIRSTSSDLYSSLSKGVHHELIIQTNLIYDRVTVLNLLEQVMGLCGLLSLISHCIDTAICNANIDLCIEKYKTIKERCDLYGRPGTE